MKGITITSIRAAFILAVTLLAVGCSSENPMGYSQDPSQISLSLDFDAHRYQQEVSGKIVKVDPVEGLLELAENQLTILVDNNVVIKYNNTFQSRGGDLSSVKIGDNVTAFGQFAKKSLFKATSLEINTTTQLSTFAQ